MVAQETPVGYVHKCIEDTQFPNCEQIFLDDTEELEPFCKVCKNKDASGNLVAMIRRADKNFCAVPETDGATEYVSFCTGYELEDNERIDPVCIACEEEDWWRGLEENECPIKNCRLHEEGAPENGACEICEAGYVPSENKKRCVKTNTLNNFDKCAVISDDKPYAHCERCFTPSEEEEAGGSPEEHLVWAQVFGADTAQNFGSTIANVKVCVQYDLEAAHCKDVNLTNSTSYPICKECYQGRKLNGPLENVFDGSNRYCLWTHCDSFQQSGATEEPLCDECETGYNMDLSLLANDVKEDDEGYFIFCHNQDHFPNCEEIEQGNCIKCETGFGIYQNGDRNLCAPLSQIEHCTSIQNDLAAADFTIATYPKCTACEATHSQDPTFQFCLIKDCGSHDTDSGVCTACKADFVLTEENEKCLDNTSGVYDNCEVIDNDTELCTLCKEDFAMKEDSGENLCEDTEIENCLVLDRENTETFFSCKTCLQGYELEEDTGECVLLNCKVTTDQVTDRLHPSHSCVECKGGYQFDDDNSHCILDTDSIADCAKIDATNQQGNLNVTSQICAQCNSGYGMVTNQTTLETSCVQKDARILNCDAWKRSGNPFDFPVCETCKEGYTHSAPADNSGKSLCLLDNCDTHDVTGQCTDCGSNKYRLPTTGAITKCVNNDHIPNCQHYSSTTQNGADILYCNECKPGFAFVQIGDFDTQCQEVQIHGCQTLKHTDDDQTVPKCETCEAGFTKESDEESCKPDNCDQFIGGVCVLCNENY